MLNHWKIKRLTKKIKAMQANRVNNQPADEILHKEIAYYHELAHLYQSLKGYKKEPYAQIMHEESLRAAADLNDAQANFQLGKLNLDEAKYRERLQQEGVFKSEINQLKLQELYKEAHAYLTAAIKLSHIEAKRLKGLCAINGWGVPVDKEGGFELVVASIEQEGSWEQVPQIFAAIGLNKPEFFAAIMQRRRK
ncbi:MAG: hypothetical protein BGO90_08540 [Legionella sp. 40-6]|nr:hypothetical protein [Legionella sp.]OJY58050.1 MAG: hypothetical protein BGO90_08540 [Legionella sp. 40-6]